MIKKDMPLGALNSFGVEARSAYYAEVNTIDNIKFAVNFAAYNQVPVLVLGGGEQHAVHARPCRARAASHHQGDSRS